MPSQRAPTQPTILLVEDDQATRRMMALLLRSEGFNVELASGGHRALALARHRTYDLIVLDLRLPDVSGLEVLARLRKDAVETPVLMLSGHGTVPTVVTAMRLGVVDFREKPLIGDDLIAAVKGAMAADSRDVVASADAADHVDALVRALAADDTTIIEFNALARALSEVLRGRDATEALAPVRPLLMDPASATPPSRAVPSAVRVFDASVRAGAHVSRDALAREMRVTPRRLSQLFIEQTGYPFRFWRRAFRVREALRRLTGPDARVSQVAYAVGYEHATQLDRDFRAMIGCTPRAFRRLHEQCRQSAPPHSQPPAAYEVLTIRPKVSSIPR